MEEEKDTLVNEEKEQEEEVQDEEIQNEEEQNEDDVKIDEKNKGEKDTNEITACLNCGAKLEEGQEFCPKCGMKRGEYKKIICKKCGEELKINQKFCPKCGEKNDIKVDNIVDSLKKGCRTKIRKINLKVLILILIAIVVLICIINFAIKGIEKLNVSVDDLLVEGKYFEAYEKADGSKKNDVLTENILAVLSNEISEGLKNPMSFGLTSAWFDHDNKKIVMNVSGTNSFGGIVSSYYYYTYSDTDKKYSLYCSLSDLSDEEYSKYDTSSESIEKILKNAARSVVKEMINKDNIKISGKIINNINKLFKDGKLNEVILISEENEA